MYCHSLRSYDEFVEWARSNRELMDGMKSMKKLAQEAVDAQDSEDSAEEFDEPELEDFVDQRCSEAWGSNNAANKSSMNSTEAAAQKRGSDTDLSGPAEEPSSPTAVSSVANSSVAVSTQWRMQAEEPTNFVGNTRGTNDGPDTNLELLWAHGYSTQGARNNLMGVWDKEGDSSAGIKHVVYPAAALMIVMEMPSIDGGNKRRSQNFYTGHRSHVTCFDVHKNGHVVASGDVSSEIHVWDAMTRESQIIIKCLVKEGVEKISFSPCGSRLATVGRDKEATVAIYDVSTGEVISSRKGLGFPNKVLDLAYAPNGEEAVVVGKAVVKFFTGIKSKQRALSTINGKIGKQGKKQTFFCCEYFGGDKLVVGCASGELYIFQNRRCVQTFQAHVLNEPVLSMSTTDGILVTGSKDGYIKTWDSTFKEVGSAIDITADVDGDGEPDSGCLDASVTAVQMRGKNLLIGTKSSDSFLVHMPTNPSESYFLERITWGHYSGHMGGLALHPTRDEFASSGGDKTVRLWSLRSNAQMEIRPLPAASRTITYSPAGDVLAVGMANGQVAMMNSRSLRAYDTWTHTASEVTIIKFSPDGKVLAVGDSSANIYLYQSGNKRNYKRHAICRGHSCGITCLDFSRNSQYLQSNDSGCELRFWDVCGNEVLMAGTMRDVTWATHTCVYTWSTSGVHEDKQQRTVFNACEGVEDIGILAVACDDSSLKLFNYPNVSDGTFGAISQSYEGHSGPVHDVRISMTRRFIVSVGSDDNTILVWRNEMEEVDDEDDASPTQSGAAGVPDALGTAEVASTDVSAVIDTMGAIVSADDGPADRGPPSGGDEFMAVQPWKAVVLNLEPSVRKFDPNEPQRPAFNPKDVEKCNVATDVDLDLLWVHGYRCHDTRNNARFTAAGSLVYSAAALGVVYSKYTGKQSFLQGVHTDDIVGLAMHPAGNVCATGELGKKPVVSIWDSQTMQTMVTIKTKHSRGVPLLAFNDGGNSLATIGLDNEHTLIVYDWAKKITVLETPTAREKVLCLTYMTQGSIPKGDKDRAKGAKTTKPTALPDIIVTGGEKHVKYWWALGRNVKSQKGLWGKVSRTHILCAVSPARDVLVTGGVDGNLHVWVDFKCVCSTKDAMAGASSSPWKVEYPHTAPIQAIWCDNRSDAVEPLDVSMWEWEMDGGKTMFPDEDTLVAQLEVATTLYTGDKKGVVACWKVGRVAGVGAPTLEYVYHFNMGVIHPRPQHVSVRSLCEQAGILAVGTLGSEIYEIGVCTLRDAVKASQAPVDVDGGDVHRHVTNHVLPKAPECKRLISGHSLGEVWGLSAHPTESVFLTAGDDQTVRCWDLQENKCLTWIKIHDKTRAIAWRPARGAQREEVAIATNGGNVYILDARVFLNPKSLLGGGTSATSARVDTTLDSTRVYVVDGKERECTVLGGHALDLSTCGEDGKSAGLLHTLKEPRKWIQDLKYSFEGSFLAVGSHDRNIYLYDVASGYDSTKTRVLKAHSSYITHVDFGLNLNGPEESYDEKTGLITIRDVVTDKDKPRERRTVAVADAMDRLILRSTCGAYELLIWEVVSGKRLKFASSVKDAWWHTLTCPFGWGVQGIWPPGSDGTDINSVARSHTWEQVPVVATVDDDGLVKVFNYPCLTVGAPDKCYRGHSAHVTNIAFTSDDGHVVTTGGGDKCVFVWGTDILTELRERNASSTANADDDTIDVEEPDVVIGRQPRLPTGGDESKAVKPWLGAVREPTGWTEPADVSAAPDAALEMRFVYGYYPGPQSLGHCDSVNEVCYAVAGVGIVYNTATHTQVHNTEHDNDILCLAVHPEGHTVVTGEQAPKGKHNKPKVVLWDVNTGVTLRVIKFHSKGVSHVCFSGSGAMLVSIGLDDDRTVAVHDTATGAKLGTGKIGRGTQIFSVSVGGDSQFCTGGKRYVKFWDFPRAKGVASELASKKGIYGKTDGSRNVMSSAYLGKDCVTGMYDGSLILWKNREAKKRVPKAHAKAVTAMCIFSGSEQGQGGAGTENAGTMIVSGGADGTIIQWNSQLKKLKMVDLSIEPVPISTHISAMSMMQGKVVVGTLGAEVFEVDWLSGEHLKIVDGHFERRGELWGLAVRPTKQEFATAGDDMTLRVWNARSQQPEHDPVFVGCKTRALAYSPDGFQLAAASIDGLVQVFNADNIDVKVGEVKVSKEWIQAIEYSGDGRLLAVACHDSYIYVICSRTFSTKRVLKSHHSAVIGLDFSADSSFMRSVSTDEELLYWDMESGKQVTSASSLRDTKWATTRCVLGWAVQGIWPKFSDKTDVNSCDRSKDGTLIATGDDFHMVKIFKYPCVREQSNFKAYKGHSEHVPTVRFSACGQYLYSVGGIDKAIIQFSVKYPKK